MPRSEIVVALDIGTTKVCVLVGEAIGGDQIEILGLGSAPSTGVRKGVVVDIPATGAAIRHAVAEAERQAGVHIGAVYVGITGEHIRSLNKLGSCQVDGEITEEHVQQARLSARSLPLAGDREVLHNITRQYIVDRQDGVRHPVGMSATRLEIEAHIITAASSFVENVIKCVQRGKVEIEELVVEPLATGLAVLTGAERQLGVVLADIGGGTTDISLFSEDAITHTGVIPVGGSHVTNDLSLAFRLDPEQAERIKLQHATALDGQVDPGQFITIRMIGEEEAREIPRMLLPQVVEPRMRELFSLLHEHVRDAAEGGIHVSTCVLSGGGALLPGCCELASEVLGMPVRLGRPRDIADPRQIVVSPIYATGVGLLRYAAQRAAGRPRRREPHTLAGQAIRTLLDLIGRMRR